MTAESQIRIWRSYSCNNSTSFHIVARFADPKIAQDAATELTAFFAENAAQMDATVEEGWNEPSAAAIELGKKYGFPWTEIFGWGDDMQVGDEPSVVAEDGVLVVYHSYCSGFPDELTAYFKARGATAIAGEDSRTPSLSVMFRIPESKEGRALRDELTKIFGLTRIKFDREAEDFRPPWSEHGEYGPASFFCDGETIGFHTPIVPSAVIRLKAWLAERGVDKPSMVLCQRSDAERFDTIAKARCTACQGDLKYLDPRLNEIEVEQLACGACGGMFELKSFPVPEIKR